MYVNIISLSTGMFHGCQGCLFLRNVQTSPGLISPSSKHASKLPSPNTESYYRRQCSFTEPLRGSGPLHLNGCSERGRHEINLSSLSQHLLWFRSPLPDHETDVCPQCCYSSSSVSAEIRPSSTCPWCTRKATKPSSNTTKREEFRSARSVGTWH